jgi:hypothetical protein
MTRPESGFFVDEAIGLYFRPETVGCCSFAFTLSLAKKYVFLAKAVLDFLNMPFQHLPEWNMRRLKLE